MRTMADIDIVRKPSRTWLWILLALIVLAAIAFVLLRPADPTVVPAPATNGGAPGAAPLVATRAA
jgi:hypothetical protein